MFFKSLQSMKSKRQDRQVEKSQKYITNPKAIKEDRWGAIDFFSDLDEPEIAVPALLSRFEFSLEHGINDSREKEKCLDGIIRHGEKAAPFIATHLQKTNRIAWPIKALDKVASQETLVESLKSCLDLGDIAFDQAKVDKNFDILCYLRDYQLPGFVEPLAGLLKFADERVRFAAAEVLIEQDDEAVPGLMEPFLSDQSAENTRLRQVALEAFLNRKWKIRNPESFPDGSVARGIRLSKAGQLEKS